jgi:hypothetical protein
MMNRVAVVIRTDFGRQSCINHHAVKRASIWRSGGHAHSTQKLISRLHLVLRVRGCVTETTRSLPEFGSLPSAGGFAECFLSGTRQSLVCRVPASVNNLFTECRTLGTAKHSTKTVLPSVKHSANMALGKGPLATVYN